MAVAKLFGEEPNQQINDELRRFKQVVETGEVVRSDGARGGKPARAGVPAAPGPAADRADERKEVGA